MGLRRGERPAGEDEFADAGGSDLVDEAGQQAAPCGGEPEGEFGQPEGRVLGADPQIAGERQGHARPDGLAVDAGDGDGRVPGQGVADAPRLGPRHADAAAGGVGGEVPGELAAVPAEAEVGAAPGEHQHADGRVLVLEDGQEVVQQGVGDGVAVLGGVQLDGEDRALPVGPQGLPYGAGRESREGEGGHVVAFGGVKSSLLRGGSSRRVRKGRLRGITPSPSGR